MTPRPARPSAGTIESVRRLAHLLDDTFVIPGTRIRFGLDPILGLVPVVGDVLSAGLGFLPVIIAHRFGLGRGLVLRMLVNLGIDGLVSLVPGLDLVLDVAFKANIRNLRLLEEALAALDATTPPPT